MALLGETRSLIGEAEQEHRNVVNQDREAAIDSALASLSDTLEAAEFSGDVDTALIHHFGRRALEDESLTNPYTNLAESIAAQPDERVPIIYLSPDSDNWGNTIRSETVFATLDREKIYFKSESDQQENVSMHAFTNETATVTHRTLSLVAGTRIYEGNLLRSTSLLIHENKFMDLFQLSESHIAEGRRSGMPSDYAFSNSCEDRLAGEATLLIGWEEIEEALVSNFEGREEDFLQEGLKLKEFFDSYLGLEPLEEKAPKLAEVIKVVTDFQANAGRIASMMRNLNL